MWVFSACVVFLLLLRERGRANAVNMMHHHQKWFHMLPTTFQRGRAQLHSPHPPLTACKPSPPAECQSPYPSACWAAPPSAALHIIGQCRIVWRGQQHTLFYSLILVLKPSLDIPEGPLIPQTLFVSTHTHTHAHKHTYIHILTNKQQAVTVWGKQDNPSPSCRTSTKPA